MPLAKSASANSVLRVTGRALAALLRANQTGALAGEDPDYLHQLRVTVRRLRTLISLQSRLLGKHAHFDIAVQLQWLARKLGPARDSDVFIDEIWPPLREVLGGGPLTASLEAQWRAQRRRNRRTAKQALVSQHYRSLLSALEQGFETQAWRGGVLADQLARGDQPARKFARHVLLRHVKRVHRANAVADRDDADALHRLRISVKKLRYVIEIFSAVLKQRQVAGMLKCLAKVQDTLGAMNDIAVAHIQIEAALRQHRGVDVDSLRNALDTWRVPRMQSLQRKFRAVWREYCRVESV